MQATTHTAESTRETVRSRYGELAAKSEAAGCCDDSGCCDSQPDATELAGLMGYSDAELQALPDGANMGLGCGNPTAFAALREGETVLDLGSGAGVDCFIAARQVGAKGSVIGVDMTPEMIEKATRNAQKAGLDNVRFKLGEIENLPLGDNEVDVVLSNCVINLSPEKQKVLNETWRVLKPGGRLTVSDIVATSPLPESVRNDMDLHCNCMGGAATVEELEQMLAEAGFQEIAVRPVEASRTVIQQWLPAANKDLALMSATIEARKL